MNGEIRGSVEFLEMLAALERKTQLRIRETLGRLPEDVLRFVTSIEDGHYVDFCIMGPLGAMVSHFPVPPGLRKISLIVLSAEIALIPFESAVTWIAHEIAHAWLWHHGRGVTVDERLGDASTSRLNILSQANTETNQLLASWGFDLAARRPSPSDLRYQQLVGFGIDTSLAHLDQIDN